MVTDTLEEESEVLPPA